jgi:uncharacterized RDD family membrane protein YckC
MERLDQIVETVSAAVSSFRYAGFLIRLGAFILDALIIGCAVSLFGSAFGWHSYYYNFHSWHNWHWHYFYNENNGTQFVVAWLYEALMTSSKYQATIGKMACGLKVITTDGKKLSFANSTGRYFAKFLSAIILFIGYLMVIWDPKKQALHDKLAKTYVVYK